MGIASPQARKNARIAILSEEMDALHYENALYWKQGSHHTTAATAQYQFRQDRLEKVRAELADLRADSDL